MMRTAVLGRSVKAGSGALAIALALALALAPAAAARDRELVIDLSPFVPDSVVGELLGVSSHVGNVVHARLDATFTSHDTVPWTISAGFQFPTGVVGISSELEGWSGAGTFTAVVETDALNGELSIPDGLPFYTWFMSWSGGKEITLPGGGVGLSPVDGVFDVLKLTLTLCDCPNGDPAAPWADVGAGVAGSAGVPTLHGAGSLCPGEGGALQLAGAKPNSPAWLVIGLANASLPFKGGVLVPSPDFVLPVATSAGGGFALPFVWPAGIPSGLQLWFQAWIKDATAVAGFAASAGLQATVASTP